MQIRECVPSSQRRHNHSTFQFTKNAIYSQVHSGWIEGKSSSEIELSTNSIRSLKQIIDAAIAKIENSQLDISPLTPEEEALFFGGEHA